MAESEKLHTLLVKYNPSQKQKIPSLEDKSLNTAETTCDDATNRNKAETTCGNATNLKTAKTKFDDATNNLQVSPLLSYDTSPNTAETTFENATNLNTAGKTFNDATDNSKASSDLMEQNDIIRKAQPLLLEHSNKENKILQLSDQAENVNDKTFIEKEKFLGALTDETTRQYQSPIMSSKPKNFLHQGEICVHTEKDAKICLITGMTFLTANKLILADQNNISIKMADVNSHSVVGQLHLDATPWDVTTVSEDIIAVTLPDAEMIQIVSVSSNDLAKKDAIKVADRCFGIHCHQRKLIVAFQSSTMVQVIDLKGHVLSVNFNDEYPLIMPDYVIANSSYIYVSNRAVKAVTKLDWNCEEVDTYDSGLGNPEGLAILEDGSIILSDHTKREIRNISGDCSTADIVLKDLEKPFALCWCEASSTLYISNFTNKQIDDFVQIYKMQK